MYYAGDSFAGLPLTHAEGWDSPGGEALFIYGSCEPPKGLDEGGCSPPIQIDHSRFSFDRWDIAVVESCFHRPQVRGVPTARQDGFLLFTGGIVLTLYARSPAEDRRLALALRQVNGPIGPNDPLPQPSQKIRQAAAEAC